METGQQRQPILGVTGPQIFSGAMASVTAAVVASYFGIAGTLVGAAITSVVATIGGALYRQSIEQAQARVVLRRNPKTGEVQKEVVAPAEPRPKRSLPWGPIIAAIVLVFALALGAVTAVEVAARKPIASLLGRAEPDSGRTSLGVAVREVSEPASQVEPTPEATIVPGIAGSPTIAPLGVPTLPATAPTETSVPGALVTPTAPARIPTNAPSSAPSAAPRQPTAAPTVPAAPGRPAGTPAAP
jgi:hypothetical protein